MGAFIGLYQSGKLKRREACLSEIVRFLEEFGVQISYRSLPVEQLIHETNRAESGFINLVDKKLSEIKHNDWHSAWNQAVEETSELNKEDKELLFSLGSQLGSSDVSGQVALLEMNKNLFSRKLTEAIGENSKKGKMYRSVGVLAGLGIAVIII